MAETQTTETRPKIRRIVAVDDNQENRELIREALENEGFQVHLASNGQEAVRVIKQVKPDLALLDYNMPGMSGLETLKTLRAQEDYTAVIFVSANTDSDLVSECLSAGADDYIRKPFRLAELVSRVKVRFRIKDLHDDLQAANARLKDLSEHDDLTGLLNMRFIYDKIDFEMKRAKRYDRYVACVMLDMDNFKTINDGADHLFGSFVLKQVGKLIASNIREVDLAARYGGDEFLVVLTEVTPTGAGVFSERLRSVIENYEFNDGQHMAKRTISIGYALFGPGDEMSPRDLVRNADHALYAAKEGGRNQVAQAKPKKAS